MPALDEVIEGLHMGDNVVWQVDRLDNYMKVVQPFVRQALKDNRTVIYVRFAPHEGVLEPDPAIITKEVDPRPGFDHFSGRVSCIIEDIGPGAFYVFDNLSSLVADWATDELVANFFQLTCPYLYELDTIAYFALTRGEHSHRAVARIRDTTQVLIDLYHQGEELYIHPLKVWNRYSSQMFLPHHYADGKLIPLFRSGDASTLSLKARKIPLRMRTDSIAPWDSVYRKLAQFSEEELEQLEDSPEIQALKQELSQMIIGNQPQFVRLADQYLTLNDLIAVRNRLIGSGRIGGKAAGVLLARRILQKSLGEVDFSEVLEEHDSFFIGSDVFFTFLVNNDLFRLRLRLTQNSQISPQEFEKVEERFLAGTFPHEIMEQFKDLLDYFGQAPIIVRSSSLLEDGFGNAFAGKYRSEFCVNQGSPENRLEAFLQAVKLVYASSVNPDALSYRKRRGLGNSDEQMAILVQRVAGMRHGEYFFPSLAGVAFSHNLYRWTDRIDPSQGIIRLVFGLGTRAVNRVGGDYPRLVAVSHPYLRPEMGHKIAVYSQKKVDLLDLASNELQSVVLPRLLESLNFPGVDLFVSCLEEGYVRDMNILSRNPSRGSVLTFNRLLAETDFVKFMREILRLLEEAYGHPVDIEFTAHVDAQDRVLINLVQCRPMRVPGITGAVHFPEDIAPGDVLFEAQRTISGGTSRPMRYIVYVDPATYAHKASMQEKQSMGRIIGELNRHGSLVREGIMMMGPGRWGSSNIMLGVNTTYSDINNTSVLVEMAREEAGHVPDVSYGTHFFLDLVESQIIYLPLYPDDSRCRFNFDFFENSPNTMSLFLPHAGPFEQLIKVIDVPAVTGGKWARVVADAQQGKAVCYLETPSLSLENP